MKEELAKRLREAFNKHINGVGAEWENSPLRETWLAVAQAALDFMAEREARARREHIISFAYGNVHLHNPAVTREMIEAEYDKLHPKQGDAK